ncbi:MAG: hypothetical protein DSZ26_01730 [Thermovibrio sp.]|nr:MAG: hypothetical protein DSZ26_01730 [Thermovibrio sp.]
MKIRKLMKLGLIVSISASLVGCGGGGGGGNAPSTVTKSGGKAIDGYLKGATVFADCNGNKKFDSNEPVAPGPTDENGDFKPFSVPASCGNANLIAMGGVDIATGKPFNGILMAPPGSKNITPLTTLVAVNPSLKSKLEEKLGNQTIDVDYVSEKVPGDIIEIASAVATAVNVASSIAPEKTEAATKVVEKIAEKLSNVTDLGNDTSLTDAIASATTEAIEEIANETEDIQSINATAIEQSLKQAIQSITNTTPDNETVSFSDVNSTITQALESATTEVASHVKATKYIPSSIEISGKEASVSNNEFSLYVPLQDLENNKKVEISFYTENPSSGTRSYNATMTVNVSDEESKRTATLVLSPVSIEIENGTLKSITVPEGAKLKVTGTDSSGSPISPVVLENEQADSTFDGTIGICSRMPSAGGCFYYDLAVVENKIQNEVPQNHPLYEITNKKGKFDVTISFDGIPVDTVTGTVEVRENMPPKLNWGDLSNVTQKYVGDTLQVCDLEATDPEGNGVDNCSIIVKDPNNNTIYNATGDISEDTCSIGCFDVSLNATGTYSFTFEATDADGLTSKETKTVFVGKWPPAPQGYVAATNEVDAQNNKITFKTSDNSTAVELFVSDVNADYYTFLPANETIDCSGVVTPITLDNVTDLQGVNKLYIYAYDAVNDKETCLNGIPVYIADDSTLLKCVATGDSNNGTINCTVVQKR